jgi:DNA repair exonuclease SbcCD ATPase subunit
LRTLPQPKKRSIEEMKQVVVLTSFVALVFPLVLTGCCRVEMADLKNELEMTKAERDDLRAKLLTAMKTRAQEQSPQGQVMGISGSLNEFQKQINAFISFREELQRREDELAKLRQAALNEAKAAQARMDKLGDQLKAETEKVVRLQGQLQDAQSAIVELQEKLAE